MSKKQKPYWNLYKELAKIGEERSSYYGNSLENMTNTCNILKDTFNILLTPTELSLVMVANKLARQKNRYKRDNILDAINYLAIALHCEENGK